jgi:DNA-binding NarL/FixJ family response regulator
VEDFVPYRKFICSTLASRRGLQVQVVGEVSDGLEAVQKAVELRPDLILLDIGLPSLNGIEVARKMRSLVPESKIIFLTQDYSADLVEEALSLGARGYVAKIKAQVDLFAAVEAALLGMTFVSTLYATANELRVLVVEPYRLRDANRDLTYPHENILGRLPKTAQN